MGGCGKRAVLFFLYGAAFQNGGNSFELYDGRYLSALGDLVVVVPNYRVGALGFLSGPWENRLPGNAGLHDQRLALEWTLANIGPFGGDTSLVVLAGHDAGAASLGYHLFNGDTAFWTRNATRFILQSGGPYHRYKGEGIEGARRLAESLRCPSDLSSDDAVTCLQRADVNAVARDPMALSFAPVFSRAPLSMPEARNAQGRSLANKGRIEGMEFLLGRAASEGVYPWFVAQHRSASSDVRRLAVRLLGEDVLERWQTATGVVLDAKSSAAVYRDAVGDVLEGATGAGRQVVPVRQRSPDAHEAGTQGRRRRAERRQAAAVRHDPVGPRRAPAADDDDRAELRRCRHDGRAAAGRRHSNEPDDASRLRRRSGRACVRLRRAVARLGPPPPRLSSGFSTCMDDVTTPGPRTPRVIARVRSRKRVAGYITASKTPQSQVAERTLFSRVYYK
ncbi:acetylcholinesterase-like isoform X2 [Dermacentor andersoni]|uniref:acetylcholinesterase-like isoform X2 n=1 Tax=Dermacentor andersoni TaxID=34620 RepID=UPI003B3BC1B0